MKTLLSYQTFSELKNKGFLKVPTIEAKQVWRKKLFDYRFLNGLNVKVSKANRKYIFNTLEKFKTAQNDLLNAIENDENDNVKDDLKEKILSLQSMLMELSLIKDTIIEDETEQKTPFQKSMIYFDKIVTNDDGQTFYVTKSGKKFTVKNPIAENLHFNLIAKCNENLTARLETNKKVKNATDKEAKKADKVDKVKTDKTKVLNIIEEAKKAEKKEALKIGREHNSTDKFTEKVFEKKRLF